LARSARWRRSQAVSALCPGPGGASDVINSLRKEATPQPPPVRARPHCRCGRAAAKGGRERESECVLPLKWHAHASHRALAGLRNEGSACV